MKYPLTETTLQRMLATVEKRMGSWNDARNELLGIAASDDDVVFRGQRNSAWPITSSLRRLCNAITARDERIDPGAYVDIEDILLEEFSRHCERIEVCVELPKERDEVIAYAQHWGLPTRMLDWSRSPVIAALFAFDGVNCQSVMREGDVAIYALNWSAFEEFAYHCATGASHTPNCTTCNVDRYERGETLRLYFSEYEQAVKLVQCHFRFNRRMLYQEGVFTRMGCETEDLEAYLTSRSEYCSRPILTKIVVPATEQAVALREMRRMGVSPALYMQDPSGAAMEAVNYVVKETMRAAR